MQVLEASLEGDCLAVLVPNGRKMFQVTGPDLDSDSSTHCTVGDDQWDTRLAVSVEFRMGLHHGTLTKGFLGSAKFVRKALDAPHEVIEYGGNRLTRLEALAEHATENTPTDITFAVATL